jgi:thioesterase domain-containing protein
MARVRYRPESYDGAIVMFNTPEAMRRQGSGSARRWSRYARGGCRAYDVKAVHSEMLHEPHVRLIAEKLSEHLERIAQRADSKGSAS